MPRRSPSSMSNLAEAFDGLRADYNAARVSRFRRQRSGLQTLGSNADYHYRNASDYWRMMEYARDMDRNDAVVGQVIDRAVSNTVQSGMVPDPQTGDPEVDKDLGARWAEWAGDPQQCDLAGERTFWAMQRLVLRHCFVDGDMIGLANEGGTLELVEAHRCRTPSNTERNVIHGVLVDETTCRHLEYWLTRKDTGLAPVQKVSDVRTYKTYDAEGFRQVLHPFVSKRVSQTRGVTALAPVFDVAGMVEDINFATLVQRQMVACFAVFHEREMGFDLAEGSTQHGARTTETLASGTSRVLEGIGPGMEMAGLPGEKLRMDSPHVPNPEFFPHMRLMLTLIGINLGMPLVMVLMDASETNFSGFRGAVDQARMGFKDNQQMLAERFCQPAYVWKVRQWLAADRALRASAARQGIKLFAHRWNAPTWPYIQPLQDAGADLLRLRNGLISARRRAAERNMDWDDLSTEICEDNAQVIQKAHEKAVELNAKYPGLNVTWREIACLPTPDGVTVSLAADGGGQPQTQAA